MVTKQHKIERNTQILKNKTERERVVMIVLQPNILFSFSSLLTSA